MGLCVCSLPISPVMIERIYALSYYHHQIGSMNYYLLFMVRSWSNGVRCMSLYILMNLWYGWIASWDIRVLVVFAPNLALCHWHAALLPCYPTDDWHLAYMFSLVYFSVEVCLVGVFPHSVSTWRDPCVRFYVPLTTVGHRRQVTAVTRLPRWRRRKTRLLGRALLTMLWGVDRCDFWHASRYWI